MFAMNFVELGKPMLMGWLKKRNKKKNKNLKNKNLQSTKEDDEEEVDNLLNKLELYSCVRDRIMEPNEGTRPEYMELVIQFG